MASGAGKSEKAHLNDALVALSALPETMVWRNNTGMAWQGERMRVGTGTMVRIEPGMVVLHNARPIKFGLPGSGDILGAHAGRPVAVEMKDERGAQRELQKNFERSWVKAGGIYILARSSDEAVNGLLIESCC